MYQFFLNIFIFSKFCNYKLCKPNIIARKLDIIFSKNYIWKLDNLPK